MNRVQEPEELGQALAKSARILARIRPSEKLRKTEEDALHLERRRFVELAFAEDSDPLRAQIEPFAEIEDGGRWLFRAAKNLNRINNQGAANMALVLDEAIAKRVSPQERAKPLAWFLTALRPGPWATPIIERALVFFDEEWTDGQDLRSWLLHELVGAELRIDPDTALLVNERAPRRPRKLSQQSSQRLKRMLEDKRSHWSRKLAALWLLAGVSIEARNHALSALERAFEQYPLEALAAVEQTQLALDLEDDTSSIELDRLERILEQLAIQKKDNPGDDLTGPAHQGLYPGLGPRPRTPRDLPQRPHQGHA